MRIPSLSALLVTTLLSGLPVLADDLVMVEQDGCHWCEKWHAEIGHIYPKTDEASRAPLRQVNLRNLPDDIAFSSPPVFTPTFVLVAEGKEVARMEGYSGDEFFWFLLGQMLQAHPEPEEITQ